MRERLDGDAALDAAARVNTRENVRLTFDHKVETVIQEIVDTNFDLYKRITDDRAFRDALKNFLFDQYLRGHRNAAELIKRGESKTLEFKSTLRWSLKENRKDDKGVTHAVLRTIAAFLSAVVGTVRAGFYDPLIAHEEIKSLLPSCQVLLGKMQRSDLEQTIVEPARQVGLVFDPPDLVQRILDEAGEDEGMLPLLQ
jgi:hypothetical protein